MLGAVPDIWSMILYQTWSERCKQIFLKGIFDSIIRRYSVCTTGKPTILSITLQSPILSKYFQVV
jgi:hypothetical protein